MKKKLILSMVTLSLVGGLLTGCGNKTVEKVDDNTVQVTDDVKDPINQELGAESITAEMLNGGSSEASTEEATTEEVSVSSNVVEELGIEVNEGSFFGSENSFSMGKIKDDVFTGETCNTLARVDILSTAYSEEKEVSAATFNYGTDISKEPTKDGYTKTFFSFIFSRGWLIDFHAIWSAYDENTGACLMASNFDYEEDYVFGEGKDLWTKESATTVIVDGVEYECTVESSFSQEIIGDDCHVTYITLAIEHPVEYDSSNIVFVVGSPTVEIEREASGDISNLRDDYDMWNLCNATYYSYSN